MSAHVLPAVSREARSVSRRRRVELSGVRREILRAAGEPVAERVRPEADDDQPDRRCQHDAVEPVRCVSSGRIVGVAGRRRYALLPQLLGEFLRQMSHDAQPHQVH